MKTDTLFRRAVSKIDDIFENRRLCYISSPKEDCRLIKAKLLTKGFGYIVISKESRPDDALKDPRKKTCELLALDIKVNTISGS